VQQYYPFLFSQQKDLSELTGSQDEMSTAYIAMRVNEVHL